MHTPTYCCRISSWPGLAHEGMSYRICQFLKSHGMYACRSPHRTPGMEVETHPRHVRQWSWFPRLHPSRYFPAGGSFHLPSAQGSGTQEKTSVSHQAAEQARSIAFAQHFQPRNPLDRHRGGPGDWWGPIPRRYVVTGLSHWHWQATCPQIHLDGEVRVSSMRLLVQGNLL